MKTFYRLFPVSLLLFLPLHAHAYQSSLLDGNSSPVCNAYFEIINFSIALVLMGIIILILNKLSNGLKMSWIYFFIASFLFAALHLAGLLKVFNIIDLSSIACLIELLMMVFLLLAVISFRKLLRQIISNKSFTQDSKGKD
ncbi:hypothetical protein JW752_02610 [Candidatus Peregrinibacteria bacterium]|nr:hypothetical protein [Candidatus Peregrinibacteria bacterium]